VRRRKPPRFLFLVAVACRILRSQFQSFSFLGATMDVMGVVETGLLMPHFPCFGRGRRRRQPRDGLEWLHALFALPPTPRSLSFYQYEIFTRSVASSSMQDETFGEVLSLISLCILKTNKVSARVCHRPVKFKSLNLYNLSRHFKNAVQMIVAALFPCPCPFSLAKRCLNAFISPFSLAIS